MNHLDELEAEAIYILREVAAECEKPVMLYSIGKDSSVMLHLAMKAFYPEKPPFPFLHVNTTWKFREMIEFRDRRAEELGIEMLEYINEEGVRQGINPFEHGASYTDIMKTQALKQALGKYGFTAAFGGGRRDEEKSRAKERIFSFRNREQAWDPKNQRPEMWKLFNTRIAQGERIREMLKQPQYKPMPVQYQVIIIYAVTHKKKAFLSLVRNNPEIFCSIPYNSLLFQKSFYSRVVNINTLNVKNLKQCRSIKRYPEDIMK